MYDFLTNCAQYIPGKGKRARETRQGNGDNLRRMSIKSKPVAGNDDYGIQPPAVELDVPNASHTFLSGGNYLIDSRQLDKFYRAYAEEIRLCMSAKSPYESPYPSINEVAIDQLHPLFFDLDFLSLGMPGPIEQAMIAYIYRVVQESVYCFYMKSIDAASWRKQGTVYITQTLARLKDTHAALLKWNPTMAKLNACKSKKSGTSATRSSSSARSGRAAIAGTSSASSPFTMMDECAMDGHDFGASYATHGSIPSISSAELDDVSMMDIEEMMSHSLSSWSAPSRIITVDSSFGGGSQPGIAPSTSGISQSQPFSTVAMDRLSGKDLYIPAAQRALSPENQVMTKTGGNMIFNGVKVTSEQNIEIASYVIDKLTEVSFNPLIHNMTRLCMLTDEPLDFVASKYNRDEVRAFWSKVIDLTVYSPSAHKRMAYSDKKTHCIPCTVIKKYVQCSVCNNSKEDMNASEGRTSVTELVYALDGDGNPVYDMPELTEAAGTCIPAYYTDAGLAMLKRHHAFFIPSEFLAEQKRYDAASLDKVTAAIYEAAQGQSLAASFPSGRVISKLAVPMIRGALHAIKSADQSNFLYTVVKRTSIRLAIDPIGISEKAWSNMLTAGFESPVDAVHHDGLPIRKTSKSRSEVICNDAEANRMLRAIIRSLREEWKDITIETICLQKQRKPLSRAPKYYIETTAMEVESLNYTLVHWVVKVMGTGGQWCAIAERKHRKNQPQFIVTPGHIFQVCHSCSTRDRPDNSTGTTCAGTFGGIWRTPDLLRERLFPNPSGAVQAAITKIANQWPTAPMPQSYQSARGASSNVLSAAQQTLLIESGYILPSISTETASALAQSSGIRVGINAPITSDSSKAGSIFLDLTPARSSTNAVTSSASCGSASNHPNPVRQTGTIVDDDTRSMFMSPPPAKRRLLSSLN